MNIQGIIEPKVITSPYTGSPVRPKFRTYHEKDQVLEEAQWWCPDTGKFIMKGITKITPKKTSK